MHQFNRIDGNTLSWVKSEIDQTMDNARQALEAYVETPDDESQLRFCLNYLHQVYGTLQMVELYGAGMLAQELESLTNALVEKKVKNREDAFEVMMRGMMQLPDYLEKLQQGQPDYPIIMLPLLNDLRAARSAALLSESALFSPDLQIDAPIPMESAEDSISTLVRKLRHAYHLGLLDWFRDNDVRTGLKRISTVIEKLRPAANDPDTSRVLWAASGVVEALRDGGINSSVAVKLLMGQVDREFKKILDKGEYALSSEPPVDLLKNLLYYVASSNSAGARVNELKNAFNLTELMPDTATLERARADLSAPNAALMRTVSSVLLDDLTQVKDSLDVFVRADNRDNAVLAGICDKLAQMGDTLDMLGFGEQRMILQDQIKILRAMSSGEREVDDAVLMDVAGALLSIESALSEPGVKPAEKESSGEIAIDESIARQFGDPEQRKLVKHVVDEVKVDLATIKDAFNDYSRAPKHIDVLQGVPALLDRIRGSLSMLTLNRVAEVLGKASSYIQTHIVNKSARPDSRTLDLLADTISSAEYYLESLTESWGHPTAILDVAEQSLSELGIGESSQTPPISLVDTDDGSDNDKTLVDLAAPELQDNDMTMELSMDATQPEIDVSGLQLEDAPVVGSNIGLQIDEQPEPIDIPAISEEPETDSYELVLDDELSEEFDLAALNDAGVEVVQDQIETPVPKPAAVPASSRQSTLADDLDEEIVEIFLEEADEEHANISRLLPHWQNNQDDDEALKNLRRSFHTLKGSGRLVGAIDVGEFAWSFENLLNRAIDRSIEKTPAMFELLEQARQTLPSLFQQFRNGQKPEQSVFTLMQRAEALSKGEEIEVAAPEAAGPAADSDINSGTEIQAEVVQAEPNILDQIDEDLIGLDPSDDISMLEMKTPSVEIELEEIEVPAEQTPTFDLQLDEQDVSVPGEIFFDESAAVSPVIDPVLLGIYRKEIATHLEALREYINDWRAGNDRSANHKLIRALHTLKGSSRTASVLQVAELCNFLEDHAKYLQDGELQVDKELVELYDDASAFIEKTVTFLDVPGTELPDNTDLIKRTRAMLEKTRNDTPTMQIEAPETLQDIMVETPQVDEIFAADVIAGDDSSISVQTIMPEADYDAELLEIFIEEGVEILDESDNTLHEWIESPDNMEHVKALQRQLHTLKGGARMAGVAEIGDLSHSIETMLTAIVDNNLDVSEEMFQAMLKAQDRLVGMLDEVRKNQRPAPAAELVKIINALARGQAVDSILLQDETAPLSETEAGMPGIEPPIEEVQIDAIREPEEEISLEIEIEDPLPVAQTPSANTVAETVPTGNDNVVTLGKTGLSEAPVSEVEAVGEETGKQQQRTRGEMIRVRSDLLDNLVNFAGEVSIYRSRMEQQTNAFRYNLTELDDTVSRLRGQLRQFEIEAEAQIQFRIEETGGRNADFDPLEFDRFTQMQTLSRGMLESLNDLDSLRGILSNLTRESETLLLQQSRVNTELQEGLMRTRMVPIGGQVPRLRRIARQTAEELGKKVEFYIHGSDNELDRTILERIMSPLEHMLRNAIAHGIEKPAARVAAGKEETGNINLGFAREGSDLVITVVDDGAGINLDAIRNKAIARGILKPGVVVSKDDLLDIILESGFSTAEEVTQIAGRGVGMDVVNNEIKQLGGLLDINTESGKGTTFTISMPMSLSVTRALLVHVGEETYAIPLMGVESVERVSRDEIARMQTESNGTYRWLEHDYNYIHLGAAMGLSDVIMPPEDVKKLPILLVRTGEYRAAIHVDSLVGSREIVVKPVGPQLSTLRGISGATVMGDGGVVLILDMGVLIRLSSAAHEKAFTETTEAEPVFEEKRIPLVMVVDDSITVRKVTTRLLERNNFKTVSAKDGVDALAQLQEYKPDVMLLDVEMPRMDGFELATNIRNDAQLKDLPIIMITSRTGQKHRDRAMDIGVNIYMGKPYSEGELLDNINNMLNQKS